MGSKAKILDFIGMGLGEVHEKGLPVVDLFSGACSISGGFGGDFQIISNDIQTYSKAIASCYLKKCKNIGNLDLIKMAKSYVDEEKNLLPDNLFYPAHCTLTQFNRIEKRNQKLIDINFSSDYHLFCKNYSGTWWSSEQCVWIDKIRQVLDELYEGGTICEADFMLGITSLMHAMAYTSQGTGHYAQYRDAKTEASMKDINIYRQKDIAVLFERKLKSLFAWNKLNVVDLKHEMYALDYKECLDIIPKSVVYADPPYAFVHYSRFYHAIETVYKYDYPEIQKKGGTVVKGRYREDRHQSPFCIKTKVSEAFSDLFYGTKCTKSHLLLSYSNTGMIGIEELVELAVQTYGKGYTVWCESMDYQHKTMGRRDDHSRDVQEALIIAKKK